jgi:RNase P/RNase MRP subunit POP5
VAKIAEQLTYDQAERDQYAVWAAKASGYITDPSVKEAILKFVANLYGPYRDNETHSHFELPDFDTPKTIF